MCSKLCLKQADRWRHSVSDVVEYVTTEKLLESTLNIFPVFIRQWVNLQAGTNTLHYRCVR
jgi:hypothetical protein